MFDAIINTFVFLVNTIVDLYAFLLIARIILTYAHTDPYNQLMIFISKVTEPLIRPIKKFIPDLKGIELSTILLIFCIELIKFFLIGLVSYGLPNVFGLIILALAEIMKLTVNVFFYAILLQVILSWFPYSFTDIYNLLAFITAPIMRPIRRAIPPIGGFDISPIPALLGLQVLVLLIIDPIYSAGMSIAFG